MSQSRSTKSKSGGSKGNRTSKRGGWSMEAAEKARQNHQYMKVGESGNLQLSGAPRRWEKAETAGDVYVPFYRLVGQPALIRQTLVAAGENPTEVDRQLGQAYSAQNYQGGMQGAFEAELAQYEQFKAGRRRSRQSTAGPTVTLADLVYFTENSDQAMASARAAEGTSPRGRKGGKRGTRSGSKSRSRSGSRSKSGSRSRSGSRSKSAGAKGKSKSGRKSTGAKKTVAKRGGAKGKSKSGRKSTGAKKTGTRKTSGGKRVGSKKSTARSPRKSTGGSKSGGSKSGGTRGGGRVQPLAERLQAAREKGKVLDVSNMDPKTGKGIRMIDPPTGRSQKIGVAGLEIVSSNPANFAFAVNQLGAGYEQFAAQYGQGGASSGRRSRSNSRSRSRSNSRSRSGSRSGGRRSRSNSRSRTGASSGGLGALPPLANLAGQSGMGNRSPMLGGLPLPSMNMGNLPTIPGQLPSTSLPVGSPPGSPRR